MTSEAGNQVSVGRYGAAAVAVAVALAATLQGNAVVQAYWRVERSGDLWVQPEVAREIGLLIFGIVLVAGDPKRWGVSLGTAEHRSKAIAGCAVVVVCVLVYRLFLGGADDFASFNPSWSVWAISPLAQELIFCGFILGLLNEAFPRRWHRAVPITTAVVITAGLFGLWHAIPDFAFYGRDASWIAFRLAYTALGWIPYAMSRLWTGSILYAVLTHMAVNFIMTGPGLSTLTFEL